MLGWWWWVNCVSVLGWWVRCVSVLGWWCVSVLGLWCVRWRRQVRCVSRLSRGSVE